MSAGTRPHDRPEGAPWGLPGDRAWGHGLDSWTDDSVEKLREDMDAMPGVLASQRRLVKYGRHVFPAFESLGIFTKEAAYEYVEAQMKAINVPEAERGRLFTILLSFGVLCAEADRELNGGADQ